MMELWPERVVAAAGTYITFNCSYRSSEKLTIEFDETVSGVKDPMDFTVTSESERFQSHIHRYPWGSERVWRLRIKPNHIMVNCHVRNSEGIEVGSLSSMIHPG